MSVESLSLWTPACLYVFQTPLTWLTMTTPPNMLVRLLVLQQESLKSLLPSAASSTLTPPTVKRTRKAFLLYNFVIVNAKTFFVPLSAGWVGGWSVSRSWEVTTLGTNTNIAYFRLAMGLPFFWKLNSLVTVITEHLKSYTINWTANLTVCNHSMKLYTDYPVPQGFYP